MDGGSDGIRLRALIDRPGWSRVLTGCTLAYTPGRQDDAPLVVAFEDDAVPAWAPNFAERRGWASLSITGNGPRAFRDDALHGLLDEMEFDGAFDLPAKVVFMGGGPFAGHAAAACSVVAPGAAVLAVSPLAVLDPARMGGYERRSDASGAVNPTVIHDPMRMPDAAQAALFRDAKHLHAPFGGSDLWGTLRRIGALDRLAVWAAADRLDPLPFARVWRARRGDSAWHVRISRALQDRQARAARSKAG